MKQKPDRRAWIETFVLAQEVELARTRIRDGEHLKRLAAAVKRNPGSVHQFVEYAVGWPLLTLLGVELGEIDPSRLRETARRNEQRANEFAEWQRAGLKFYAPESKASAESAMGSMPGIDLESTPVSAHSNLIGQKAAGVDEISRVRSAAIRQLYTRFSQLALGPYCGDDKNTIYCGERDALIAEVLRAIGYEDTSPQDVQSCIRAFKERRKQQEGSK